MLVTTLDWSDYVGRIAIGRIYSGTVRPGQDVALMQTDDRVTPGANRHGLHLRGPGPHRGFLRRRRRHRRPGGTGKRIEIGDTLSDPESPRALPRVVVDEPTLKMTFGVNTSPLAGRDGRYLTSRHLRERLARELQRNVALSVEPITGTEQFSVAGRGILHLSVLIETMRREGYEISVGKPQVILHRARRRRRGAVREPGGRSARRKHRRGDGVGRAAARPTGRDDRPQPIFLLALFHSRAGLIGLRTRLLNATQGTAVIHHRFDRYKPMESDIPGRATGVLVSTVAGRAVAYGLDTLQQRAEMHVAPGDVVYEGMIVGENSRSGDMNVNPTKEKKLSNMRAVGHDRNILLKPPRRMSLEEALEFIADDELVEVTPSQIRLRKIILKEIDRRRAERSGANRRLRGASLLEVDIFLLAAFGLPFRPPQSHLCSPIAPVAGTRSLTYHALFVSDALSCHQGNPPGDLSHV